MVGGTNFRKSQFNLATQAERQPGSAFKPIVLASAFRRGISPLTQFDSKPVVDRRGRPVLAVTNYESSYPAAIELTSAMVTSDNSVYAQLTELVGPKAIVETAHDSACKRPLDAYFSIGLGSAAVNPLEMARAYATVANEGRRVDGAVLGDRPRVIERVGSRAAAGGRKHPATEAGARLRPGRVLTDILEDVVRCGTGKRANLAGRRSRARPAPRTTTRTRGSSGTRRSSSSPSGSATRTGCVRCSRSSRASRLPAGRCPR